MSVRATQCGALPKTWAASTARPRAAFAATMRAASPYAPWGEAMPSNLRIDPDRLWSTLVETAAIGGTAKGGINRQTLTDHDRVVRAWFKRETEALGCTVTVDEVGNMFALRPGRHKELAPIALGSHLDTQPTGGTSDGHPGALGPLRAQRRTA